MKKAFLLIGLFCSVFSFAQDYQMFNSEDTLYFKTANTGSDYGNVLTIAFDSVQFVNGDSIYYPYNTLHQNELDTLFDCPWIWNGNWLGREIIEQSNGKVSFVTGTLDMITIDPTAPIGTQTYLCDHYSNDSVMATVTDISWETFLGISDSVKTITLNSSYPLFYMENMEIRISKNHGVISMVPMFNFPYNYDPFNAQTNYQLHLVGHQNLFLGMSLPSAYDFHNLELGDQIVYITNNYNLFHYIHDKTVIEKTLLPGSMVNYKFLYKEKYTYSGTSWTDPGFTVTSVDTISETYSISQDVIITQLPGQTLIVGTDQTYKLSHSDECGFWSTMQSRNTYEDASFECRSSWHMNYTTSTAISGANNYYSNCWNVQPGGCNESTYFSFKSNSGVECGTPFFVSIDKHEVLEQLQIFPNPANSDLVVTAPQLYKAYTIFSLDGKTLSSGALESSIDVSFLEKGTYILLIKDDAGRMLSRRFVKD